MEDSGASGSKRRGCLAAGFPFGVAAALAACPQLADDDFTVLTVDIPLADGSTPEPPDPPGITDSLDASAETGPLPEPVFDASVLSDAGDSGSPHPPPSDGGAHAPIDWTQCTLSTPEPVTGLVLTSGSEFGPAISADAFELVFSSTSPGNENLFRATRADRNLAFSAASPMTALNTAAVEGTAFIGASGLHLYFQSTRAGGPGGRDLYMAVRTSTSGAFENPELLSDINSAQNDQYPRLSPDELTLHFTSSRPGGQGSNDLWTATRATLDDAFADATPLTELNGPSDDEGGTLTSDGRCIFFNSNRLGTLDLYMATRATAEGAFGTPINLVAINSSEGEFNPALTGDDRELFFSSNRGMPGGEYHLFRSLLDCP